MVGIEHHSPGVVPLRVVPAPAEVVVVRQELLQRRLVLLNGEFLLHPRSLPLLLLLHIAQHHHCFARHRHAVARGIVWGVAGICAAAAVPRGRGPGPIGRDAASACAALTEAAEPIHVVLRCVGVVIRLHRARHAVPSAVIVIVDAATAHAHAAVHPHHAVQVGIQHVARRLGHHMGIHPSGVEGVDEAGHAAAVHTASSHPTAVHPAFSHAASSSSHASAHASAHASYAPHATSHSLQLVRHHVELALLPHELLVLSHNALLAHVGLGAAEFAVVVRLGHAAAAAARAAIVVVAVEVAAVRVPSSSLAAIGHHELLLPLAQQALYLRLNEVVLRAAAVLEAAAASWRVALMLQRDGLEGLPAKIV
mmetsp:Transcript_37383/g.79741  ORF Transcript_37383/g.79741 Transcript_37383/m.79741 type:complete len:366 (-) Transcript_37383:1241-2338(-)